MEQVSAGQNELNENFILFYSQRCGQCQKFIKLLQDYPHINTCFQKLEVEELQKTGKLPPQLTHIPGVIEGNQLLMGPNSFEWLKDKCKKNVGHAPLIDNKHGLSGVSQFSFVGNSNDDYSPGFATYGKETENNGSNIDPSDFDTKTGQKVTPTTSMYNPKEFTNNQMNQETNLSSQTNNVTLPQQLQPEKIDNSDSKVSDSDMQRYMQNRDSGITIPNRQ
tara:strand:+ start:535 stop:1197 length:663 start_codon:yes stop_codon:yes gene_type:complete